MRHALMIIIVLSFVAVIAILAPLVLAGGIAVEVLRVFVR